MLHRTGPSALRQITNFSPWPRVSLVIQQAASSRLLSSLAVLEQREGRLNVSSLGAVTAAQQLGGSVTGIVAGSNIRTVAEEAAKVKGLDKIVMIENASYDKVQQKESM